MSVLYLLKCIDIDAFVNCIRVYEYCSSVLYYIRLLMNVFPTKTEAHISHIAFSVRFLFSILIQKSMSPGATEAVQLGCVYGRNSKLESKESVVESGATIGISSNKKDSMA